jgi:hypothetical protein
MAKQKWINRDLQDITHITKDRTTQTPLIPGVKRYLYSMCTVYAGMILIIMLCINRQHSTSLQFCHSKFSTP